MRMPLPRSTIVSELAPRRSAADVARADGEAAGLVVADDGAVAFADDGAVALADEGAVALARLLPLLPNLGDAARRRLAVAAHEFAGVAGLGRRRDHGRDCGLLRPAGGTSRLLRGGRDTLLRLLRGRLGALFAACGVVARPLRGGAVRVCGARCVAGCCAVRPGLVTPAAALLGRLGLRRCAVEGALAAIDAGPPRALVRGLSRRLRLARCGCVRRALAAARAGACGGAPGAAFVRAFVAALSPLGRGGLARRTRRRRGRRAAGLRRGCCVLPAAGRRLGLRRAAAAAAPGGCAAGGVRPALPAARSPAAVLFLLLGRRRRPARRRIESPRRCLARLAARQ